MVKSVVIKLFVVIAAVLATMGIATSVGAQSIQYGQVEYREKTKSPVTIGSGWGFYIHKNKGHVKWPTLPIERPATIKIEESKKRDYREDKRKKKEREYTIKYGFNKWNVDKYDITKLEELRGSLESEDVVIIEAYTDAVGSMAANKKVAKYRAIKINRLMQKRGIKVVIKLFPKCCGKIQNDEDRKVVVKIQRGETNGKGEFGNHGNGGDVVDDGRSVGLRRANGG